MRGRLGDMAVGATFKSTLTPTKKQERAAWFSELTPSERSTFVATFGGWALDGMDVMVYSFVIPSLITAWHISKGEAGMLGTAALLVSAVGGWLAGLLADRFGRTRVLQWTILWFALFTFLCGFTSNFWQLLIVRGLEGLGFGGEWAVGSVLMGETIRAEHRGKAVGTVQGGWAIGWGIAAICSVAFFTWLPANLAWRAMFWIGILPALLVFYIRRHVPEPEVFTRTRQKLAASCDQSHFLEIFSRSILKITVLASVLSVGAQGGYYAITTWLPTYLKTVRHLSVLNTGWYMIVIIAGSFCGYLTGAYLADGMGRKKALILFAACCALTVTVYTYLPFRNGIVMQLLGFPLGFFTSGSFSPIGAFFTELFPSRLRGSGQGFSYNLGRGVGALFPTLVGFLSARFSLGKAIAIFAVSAYVVMVLAVLILPETKGKILQVYE
jgi:MFS family permease